MPIGTLPEPTKGVVPVPKAPPGATVVGQLPDSTPVYEMEFVEVVRNEDGSPAKDPVKGPNGEPMWVKHPTTGEALYPKLRIRKARRKRKFVLNIERNERGVGTGQVTLNFNFEPDPAEKARLEKAAKVRDFQSDLATRAVEMGLTVDELLARALAPHQPAEAPGFSDPVANEPPAADIDPADYPKMMGPGLWALTPEHEQHWQADTRELFRGTKAEALAKCAEITGQDA